MRVLLILATTLLALLALIFAPLSLAAFASINPSVSDALRLLSVVERELASRLGAASLDAFWRGLAYLLLASACMWLAAYVKPRR